MSASLPPHRVDQILALLVPDRRKRIAGVPTVNPRTVPENRPLLIELIESGFMEGSINDDGIRIERLTWKGCDLYNACLGENIRIRLCFRCGQQTPVEQIYGIAIELHAHHSQERVRRTKKYL